MCVLQRSVPQPRTRRDRSGALDAERYRALLDRRIIGRLVRAEVGRRQDRGRCGHNPDGHTPVANCPPQWKADGNLLSVAGGNPELGLRAPVVVRSIDTQRRTSLKPNNGVRGGLQLIAVKTPVEPHQFGELLRVSNYHRVALLSHGLDYLGVDPVEPVDDVGIA